MNTNGEKMLEEHLFVLAEIGRKLKREKRREKFISKVQLQSFRILTLQQEILIVKSKKIKERKKIEREVTKYEKLF